MFQIRFPLWLFSLGMVVIASTGCGDNGTLARVTGTVTLDGKPLANAGVMFHPQVGVPASGTTNAEGKFSLSTHESGDGATIGPNAVTVAKSSSVKPDAKVEEGEIVAMKLETPAKYGNPKSSGINIDVKHGMQPVNLDLVSDQKK